VKLFLFAITALLILANIATAARALSSNEVVLAKVPFNFTVGHNQLPSGTYTISRDPWGMVTMKSVDRRFAVSVTTTFEPDLPKGDKLFFRRYGERYFLGRVSSSAFSAHFPESNLEKTLRHQGTQTVTKSLQ
jgi:hypothetical protein